MLLLFAFSQVGGLSYFLIDMVVHANSNIIWPLICTDLLHPLEYNWPCHDVTHPEIKRIDSTPPANIDLLVTTDHKCYGKSISPHLDIALTYGYHGDAIC